MERNVLNPIRWFHFLKETRYLHFFLIGMTGVGINLALTAFFTEFIFGRKHYLYGYLIGLMANLLYNFALHTRVTFKTRGGHRRRLTIFLAYSLAMTYLQVVVVRRVTALFGVDWYLAVIASVIFGFSIVTFILFKFILFREPPAGD